MSHSNKKKMLTLHYTGQLFSGVLEKGKEREKEIRRRWKGRRKEGERWDRIMLGGGGGCRECQVSAAICSNSNTPILPLYTPPSLPIPPPFSKELQKTAVSANDVKL